MADGDSSEPRCPRGHVLPEGAKRCAECWLRLGLEPKKEPAAMPSEIGGYEIVKELGHGAHGRVFLARQRGAGMLVALKVGEPERDVTSLMRLEHPGIVRILDAGGVYDDPPHFAMQLVEGGTLGDDKWLDWFHAPERALELMIDVADALQYAHERLVLHRDIKPSNILIDPRGKAHVSDFSVAKLLDDAEPALTRTAVGTYPYMSPEQARAIEARVTTASDVYGLGALLYQLLTRYPPRTASSLEALQESFATQPDPQPMQLPSAWSDLEAVCFKALSKDPSARYGSAALFAEDLRRVKAHDWLPWRPPSVRQRLVRWTSRNRWVASSIALGALLLTAINVLAFNSVRSQEAELHQLVLKANAALAKAQAQVALAELDKYRHEAAQAVDASTTLLEEYLARPAQPKDNPGIGLLMPGFDTAFVIGCDGFIRAHSFTDEMRKQYPNGPPNYFSTDYSFRDYFRGAMELGQRGARDVYISRAFRSAWDQRLKFAFSAPIYASATQDKIKACVDGSSMIGVFVATRSASSTLGAVQIPELEGSGQHTILFGPRDRDRPDTQLPAASAFHVIVHEKLTLGREQPMDPQLAARLSQRFPPAATPGRQFEASDARPFTDGGYVDTLDDPHARWLGGFFPVGKTGFIVGVETGYGKASHAVRRSETLLALNLGFFLYCLAALWLSARKRVDGPASAALGLGVHR